MAYLILSLCMPYWGYSIARSQKLAIQSWVRRFQYVDSYFPPHKARKIGIGICVIGLIFSIHAIIMLPTNIQTGLGGLFIAFIVIGIFTNIYGNQYRADYTMYRNVLWRAHRTLKHMDAYEDLTSRNIDVIESIDKDIFQPGEVFVGIYHNSSTDIQQDIIITDQGLYYFLQSWQFVAYREMQTIKVPLNDSKEKAAAHTIVITTKENTVIEIYVGGGSERTSDVWGFLRFLMRVTDTR